MTAPSVPAPPGNGRGNGGQMVGLPGMSKPGYKRKTPRVSAEKRQDFDSVCEISKPERTFEDGAPPAPPPAKRQGDIQALCKTIENSIRYEYALFELRTSRVKRYEIENKRIEASGARDNRKRALAEAHRKHRFIFEQAPNHDGLLHEMPMWDHHPLPRGLTRPIPPPRGLRPTSSEGGKHVFNLPNPDAGCGAEPGAAPFYLKAGVLENKSVAPFLIQAADPCSPAQSAVNAGKDSAPDEVSDADDPLTHDAVWQRLGPTVPQEAKAEARYRRMQEINAAHRESRRLYMSSINSELAKEELHVTFLRKRLLHNQGLDQLWREQAESVRSLWLEQEAAASSRLTQSIQRELKLAVEPTPEELKAEAARERKRQRTLSSAEIAAQRSSWQSLFAPRAPEGKNPSAHWRVAFENRDHGEETRRWLGVWRAETDRHHCLATKIQCSWRCHAARGRVRRAVRLRRTHQRHTLRAEAAREEEFERLVADFRWNCMRNTELAADQAAKAID
eukprot:gene12053-18618_t